MQRVELKEVMNDDEASRLEKLTFLERALERLPNVQALESEETVERRLETDDSKLSLVAYRSEEDDSLWIGVEYECYTSSEEVDENGVPLHTCHLNAGYYVEYYSFMSSYSVETYNPSPSEEDLGHDQQEYLSSVQVLQALTYMDTFSVLTESTED